MVGYDIYTHAGRTLLTLIIMNDYRFELGRGTPISVRSSERLQSGSTYTVYMDRSGNQGRLLVSGQVDKTGDDTSRFSLLNLYTDDRFVIYLGT